MITIEEFLNKKHIVGMTELIAPIMIEFAQMHVKEALKEASEKATCCEGAIVDLGFEIISADVNKNSIINAYPLDLIK
jgi:hypothetical protein